MMGRDHTRPALRVAAGTDLDGPPAGLSPWAHGLAQAARGPALSDPDPLEAGADALARLVQLDPALVWAVRELGADQPMVVLAGCLEGLTAVVCSLADEAQALSVGAGGSCLVSAGERAGDPAQDPAMALAERLRGVAIQIALMGAPLGPDGGPGGPGLAMPGRALPGRALRRELVRAVA